MKVQKKHDLKRRRHWRIRTKVNGTTERPRMSACFTNTHIYVQFIDDTKGATLATVSTRSKGRAAGEKLSANVKSAVEIGKQAAQAAMGKGITRVVFDRGGNPYHGKVKALADAAREAGLKF
ncbi:MAG TPA: 50S ribosomal protein L18 [Verrucomicrobiae bacterium]|nr:50S ribosomal protein L18 [Verrucomicrobiae bacterium]